MRGENGNARTSVQEKKHGSAGVLILRTKILV